MSNTNNQSTKNDKPKIAPQGGGKETKSDKKDLSNT